MEPFDEAVAIENSHQHTGTKIKATKRLAVNSLSSAHTLVILQPLVYKNIAGQKQIKLSVERGTFEIDPLGNEFILNR